MEYSIAMVSFDGKLKSLKVITVFLPAVVVSETLIFTNVDLETLGQGHRIQHTQSSQSVANTTLNESNNMQLLHLL